MKATRRSGGRGPAEGADKWRRAHIRIRCRDASHRSGSCREIRDALLDSFRLVSEAALLRPTGDNDRFCVMATADLPPGYEAPFRRGLMDLRVEGGRKARMDKLEVYVTS